MNTLKTIKDLQQASGFISRSFIYDQIKQGKLPKPIKVGRCSRWKAEDVVQWLENLSQERGLSDTSQATQAQQRVKAKTN